MSDVELDVVPGSPVTSGKEEGEFSDLDVSFVSTHSQRWMYCMRAIFCGSKRSQPVPWAFYGSYPHATPLQWKLCDMVVASYPGLYFSTRTFLWFEPSLFVYVLRVPLCLLHVRCVSALCTCCLLCPLGFLSALWAFSDRSAFWILYVI